MTKRSGINRETEIEEDMDLSADMGSADMEVLWEEGKVVAG